MKVKSPESFKLTRDILIAMFSGALIGLAINMSPIQSNVINQYLVNGVFQTIGTIFITLMKMLVVPIVLVSLISGVGALGDLKQLQRVGAKTLGLYLFTTGVAITIGLIIATLFNIGGGSNLAAPENFQSIDVPSLKQTIIDMFPANPFKAMVNGDMLKIIIFAILFGVAISSIGEKGKAISKFFEDINEVILALVSMIMVVAPYGVFCLIANQFAHIGIDLIVNLLEYFFVVIFVLLFHLLFTNTILLMVFAKLNPITFFKKMFSAMVFAFSTSSSSVSIPVTLTTVEKKLGVKNSIASFVIPLGATINMDGTAIMQGVATVFIANSYGIDIGMIGYLTVILTATLASIGTAGVPGVGLITLVLVLEQVGLPAEGIAMIIGVDRLLDMLRTSVNITGDSAVACIVAKSENRFNKTIFNKKMN